MTNIRRILVVTETSFVNNQNLNELLSSQFPQANILRRSQVPVGKITNTDLIVLSEGLGSGSGLALAMKEDEKFDGPILVVVESIDVVSSFDKWQAAMKHPMIDGFTITATNFQDQFHKAITRLELK